MGKLIMLTRSLILKLGVTMKEVIEKLLLSDAWYDFRCDGYFYHITKWCKDNGHNFDDIKKELFPDDK